MAVSASLCLSLYIYIYIYIFFFGELDSPQRSTGVPV